MDEKEFRNTVCKKRGNKGPHKVRDSWGVYDVYKYIRKHGWYSIGKPVKEHDYYSIIRKVNQYFAEELVNGHSVEFPHSMGTLELKKIKNGVSIVDGQLHISYPVNWDRTLSLWYEDREAMRDKVLVREENPHRFKVHYNKYGANYTNRDFYQFSVNRKIKVALKEKIENQEIDTLW